EMLINFPRLPTGMPHTDIRPTSGQRISRGAPMSSCTASPGSGSFITTTCPTCGPTDIGIERVVLRVDEVSFRTVASIHCPGCGSRSTKRGADAMSLLMARAGVEVHTVTRPAEVDERPVHLPPLTRAEIEEFVAELAGTNDLIAALSES